VFSEEKYTYVFNTANSQRIENEWSDPLKINNEKKQLCQIQIFLTKTLLILFKISKGI